MGAMVARTAAGEVAGLCEAGGVRLGGGVVAGAEGELEPASAEGLVGIVGEVAGGTFSGIGGAERGGRGGGRRHQGGREQEGSTGGSQQGGGTALGIHDPVIYHLTVITPTLCR